jgi:hypothetical protein
MDYWLSITLDTKKCLVLSLGPHWSVLHLSPAGEEVRKPGGFQRIPGGKRGLRDLRIGPHGLGHRLPSGVGGGGSAAR